MIRRLSSWLVRVSDDKTQILGYLKTVYPTADNFIHEGSLYSLNMAFPFVIRVCVIVLAPPYVEG